VHAFLDACVLYPPLVRAVLLGAAEAGLCRPAWSPRVLAEWHIAVARKQGAEAAAAVERTQSVMRLAFPDAEITPHPEWEGAPGLPDPADAHVIAAAVAARADTLVTFNLRDFPTRRLAAHGITVRHPDGLLWELWSQAPGVMTAVVRHGTGVDDPAGCRRVLKRARLPRLGKAMLSGEPGGS